MVTAIESAHRDQRHHRAYLQGVRADGVAVHAQAAAVVPSPEGPISRRLILVRNVRNNCYAAATAPLTTVFCISNPRARRGTHTDSQCQHSKNKAPGPVRRRKTGTAKPNATREKSRRLPKSSSLTRPVLHAFWQQNCLIRSPAFRVPLSQSR